LQGSLSFAEIILEAKNQLGIQVNLPLKADSETRMDYNQVITLRQLAQAVVVHFAQDDIPLAWDYKAKALNFERTDLRPKDRQWSAKEKRSVTSSPSVQNRYPVPTIRTPPESEKAVLPRWAQERTVTNKVNETVIPIADLPSLSQSGVKNPSWSTGSSASKASSGMGRTSSSYNNLSSISREPGAFTVKIPQKPPQVIRAQPSLETFESPSSPMGGATRSTTNSSASSNWPTNTQPSLIGTSPSYRSPQTSPVLPRRGGFNITPYPEGAVAFINDAPSIVPGAAKEGFIEWATRLRGALREGNLMVLESEKEELERRLRWLSNHIK
jgi:hypothetical protein